MNPLKQALRNKISLNIPDNHVRQVTPALLREVLEQMLDFPEHLLTGGVQDLTTTEDSAEWDVELGSKAMLTLTNDIALFITNPLEGGLYWLIVRQDGEGGKNISFPGNSIFEGEPQAMIDGRPNAMSILTVLFDGTNYLWLGKATNSNAGTLWQQTEW